MQYLQTVAYRCKLCNELHEIKDRIFYEHYEANSPPARRLSIEEVKTIFGEEDK